MWILILDRQLRGGLKIVHGIGIVLGHEVHAKKNLTLYQHVTLGGNMGQYAEIEGVRTGQPFIGENVIVYTGASVFGPVYVPDNSTIKAGSITTTKKREEINS